MQKDAWFRSYGSYYGTNGYSKPPWEIYDRFLGVVETPGPFLELGCGNGLLLRYLCDLSGWPLLPFGVDLNATAVREAREVLFPDRKDCFAHADLREGIPFSGPFATILANPLYADQGYYEQVDGKIPRLYLDGAIEALVARCWQTLAANGRLVLWCYDGHLAEIQKDLAAFRAVLAGTYLDFREVGAGPVQFWTSRRKE